jgi:ABC-type uncharacterized transport system permease subunit
MPGNSAHGHAAFLVAGGEGDLELSRGGFCVVEEKLVEVAHAKEEKGVRMLPLGSPILPHQGRLSGGILQLKIFGHGYASISRRACGRVGVRCEPLYWKLLFRFLARMFLLWLRVAAIFYGLASVSAFVAVLGGRARWQRICLPIAVLAWFFHAVSCTEMLALAHRWMPVGMHEVQSLLALLIATVFLLIAWRYRTLSFGVFALPLALLLTVVPALGHDKYTFSSPVIRSGWLFVHIAALLTAYAALIFSLGASLLYLIQERRLKNKRSPGFLDWLPSLETMDQIAQATLVLGFCGMTVGLFAGSLIAQERYGAAYFADPKIWASFLMWGLYVVMLFVRRSTGLRGLRAVYLSSLVFLAMITVWAANVFSSVHRFGAP